MNHGNWWCSGNPTVMFPISCWRSNREHKGRQNLIRILATIHGNHSSYSSSQACAIKFLRVIWILNPSPLIISLITVNSFFRDISSLYSALWRKRRQNTRPVWKMDTSGYNIHCIHRHLVWTSYKQGRRLRVASGATAPGPALEGAPRFRPMSLSSYILR
jgi:hypothetical protein